MVANHTETLVNLLECPFLIRLCAKNKDTAAKIIKNGLNGSKNSKYESPMPPKPRDISTSGITQHSIDSIADIAAPSIDSVATPSPSSFSFN
ncbi:MAG: hypothetical protein COA82_02820 [Alkaliphilus sp.]|nr:hypothetical protein [bacterium AH-315-L21]MBN4069281.1 hypothetical protein [bacterium AH-315-G05]PHS35970.1 MAG: hypothetical protein COA82_02820 [Alkaliphilus sp.]